MALTTAQLERLQDDIAANTSTVNWQGTPTAINALPLSADANFEIARWYNQKASPDWFVWRSHVSTYEIRNVLIWSEYDALSVSKQNAFTFLCSNGFVDARLTNVRQGISSIFSGGTQSGNLAALVAVAKGTATRAQKLFSTGTGTVGSPATMDSNVLDSFQLSMQDVDQARTLPA